MDDKSMKNILFYLFTNFMMGASLLSFQLSPLFQNQAQAQNSEKILFRGEDYNADGLLDDESSGETDPTDIDSYPDQFTVDDLVDSDGDGLSDEFEMSYTMINKYNEIVFLNQYDKDSDDDGLTDFEELNYYQLWKKGSNPNEFPSLRAMDFWRNNLFLNPLNPDSDGDGIPDGTEVGVTKPIEDGDVFSGPDGLLYQIRGTNTDSKFKFQFLLKNIPDYDGDSPHHLVTQNRFTFRADLDPGFGTGSYYTHPGRADSNNNGLVDGLEDYQETDLSSIFSLENKDLYNKESNYNGSFELGERDAQSGLYEIEIDSDTNARLSIDGSFNLPYIDENNSGTANPSIELYYISGPILPDSVEFIAESPYVDVEPATAEDLEMGQRIRLKLTNNDVTGSLEPYGFGVYWVYESDISEKKLFE